MDGILRAMGMIGSQFLLVTTVGYLTLTRSFSYIGLVPVRVFLGELLLAGFVLFRPKEILGRLVTPLVRRGAHLATFCWGLFAMILFGGFQVLRSYFDGFDVIRSLQIFAFTYYMLFVFIGMWWGARDSRAIPRLILVLAWWNAVYGLANVFLLGRLPLQLPWASNVPLFAQTIGSTIALIGLLNLRPRLRFWRTLLVLNAFVLLGTQSRGLWLGCVVALVVGAVLARRIKELVIGTTIIALLLVTLLVTDVRLPGPLKQGGVVSADEIMGLALSLIDTQAASRLTPRAASYRGTADWRIIWWREIWREVHEQPASTLFGFGYGYPLGDLSPAGVDAETRSPHNWFLFTLGYGGWIGFLLYAWCQSALGWALWRVYRRTRSPFGLLVWVNGMAAGMTGNFLEAPFGAIPLYLISGLCLAQVFLPSNAPGGTASAGDA